MNQAEHFRSLVSMYDAAPINKLFLPSLVLSEGVAEITLAVKECFLQSAGSLHGSVFFKILDEAASFAAYSIEPEFFMVTSSFVTYITRPVSKGILRGVGKVVNKTGSQCLAEAVVYDGDNVEVARGNGIFVRSKLPFVKAMGYCLENR